MASALLFLLLWNNCSICDSATPECLLCYLSSHYVCSSAHRKGTQFLLLQISNLRCSFFFLHFSLACLTELCSVTFSKISSFRTSKVSKLSMTVKIDYVTSDTRDVDPKLVWVVHVWMGKKAAREQKNWSRVKSYKSLYYFILLLSFLLANHM